MQFPRQKLADYAVNGLQKGDKKLAGKIAAYLVSEGKTSEVNSLARDILQIQADSRGVVEVTAVTAHELDEKLRFKIEKLIKSSHPEAEKVIINQQLDESVIGGVRLELANEMLDNTVDARLDNLREKTRI